MDKLLIIAIDTIFFILWIFGFAVLYHKRRPKDEKVPHN